MIVPVLLQSRVDALVVGYQVQVPAALNDEIDERQSLSDIARVAELKLGEFRFSMKRNRTNERFCFENQNCRCVYDRGASNSWNLEVVTRATSLATHTLPQSFAVSKSVAKSLGDVVASRLRRVDWAADYMSFVLARLDADHFLTTRSRIDGFLVDAKDVDRLGLDSGFGEHLDGNRQVTGFTIARGNPLSGRVYNKRAELALAGREEKRAIEEELWRRRGWTGEEPVSRVELQVRGEALDGFHLRNPDDLESRLDGVWQYGVGRWMRLIEPTRARRRECPLDPRWLPVTETIFKHPSEPATRRRLRGGATAPQALGTTLSRLEAIGSLPRVPPGDERRVVTAMSAEEAGSCLKALLESAFERQAADCFEQLILTKGGAHPALLDLVTKINARRARLWSFDDLLGLSDSNGVIIV
jgi:hypothetical protein